MFSLFYQLSNLQMFSNTTTMAVFSRIAEFFSLWGGGGGDVLRKSPHKSPWPFKDKNTLYSSN